MTTRKGTKEVVLECRTAAEACFAWIIPLRFPEAIFCMAVLPDQGFAGLVVNAENGSESERAEMAV